MTENEIGTLVIDTAISVHRELGPGLLEVVYEVVLARELNERGLTVDRQVPVPITYKGIRLGQAARVQDSLQQGHILPVTLALGLLAAPAEHPRSCQCVLPVAAAVGEEELDQRVRPEFEIGEQAVEQRHHILEMRVEVALLGLVHGLRLTAQQHGQHRGVLRPPRRDGVARHVGLPSTQMVLDADGKLGIGTTSPGAMLEVETTASVHGIQSTSPSIPVSAHRSSTSGTWPAVHAECDSRSANASAVRALITSTEPGSGSAAVRGVNSGTGAAGIGVVGTQGGSGWGVHGQAPAGRGVYGLSTSGTGVYGKSTTGYAGYFEGRVSVQVLEIRGADLAERFPVSEEVSPGMVLAIDPERPGNVCVARGAYNRCVAGVVSGANELPAGAVLGHLPSSHTAPAVALCGRVWVFCDAGRHAIEPGDLLTSSDTAGHAMGVRDYARAHGAIIGKAMTPLESGRGLVLTLVDLQ